MSSQDGDILAAQLDYYRRRAVQYDDDLYRDPRVLSHLDSILSALEPAGRTLELACGTGVWTECLATRVSALTAVDGSAEMLAHARERLGTAEVSFIEADLFDWHPPERYETIFFAFWLSHVPPSRVELFWRMLSDSLTPGGRVLFVDNGPDEARRETFVQTPRANADIPLVERPLLDGSSHQVVKVLYEPEELTRKLEGLGWRANVQPAGGTLFAGTAQLTAPAGGADSVPPCNVTSTAAPSASTK